MNLSHSSQRPAPPLPVIFIPIDQSPPPPSRDRRSVVVPRDWLWDLLSPAGRAKLVESWRVPA
jgi:hypothetical protein